MDELPIISASEIKAAADRERMVLPLLTQGLDRWEVARLLNVDPIDILSVLQAREINDGTPGPAEVQARIAEVWRMRLENQAEWKKREEIAESEAQTKQARARHLATNGRPKQGRTKGSSRFNRLPPAAK
jgi:hypothetical protein